MIYLWAVVVLAVVGIGWLLYNSGAESGGKLIGRYDPRRRLKRATRLKRDGKLDEACDFLLDLLDRWESDPPRDSEANIPEDYPEVDHYWKAANYLQRAGRTEEAWSILSRVIGGEYPRRIRLRQYCQELEGQSFRSSHERKMARRLLKREPEGSTYQDRAKIHDKTRLFFKREGRRAEAAKHKLLAYGAEVLWLWYDGQVFDGARDQLADSTSREAIEEAVSSATKVVDRPELDDDLTDLLACWVQRVPEASLGELEERVGQLLGSED